MKSTLSSPCLFKWGRLRGWGTLRFQFALMTGLLLLVAMVGFGVFVYFSLSHSLKTSVDDSLRLNASQALAVIEVENDELDIPDSFIEGPETNDLRAQGFILRLLDADGTVLHAFGSYQKIPVSDDSISAAQRQKSGFSTFIDIATGDYIRLYTVPITNDNRTIGIYQVGQALTGIQDTLARLLRTLVISIPILVLVAGMGGYLLAARALRPVDRITRTALQISAEDLSARLDLPAADDEVGRLAAAFDRMLVRLDESFQRERQFTADASHELRTPLAAMQTVLDVTREKQRSVQEYVQALDDLAEETDRLGNLTRNLLLLARSHDQVDHSHREVDLSLLLQDLSDSVRLQAENKALHIVREIPDGLSVSGDMDGLIRLFANLLDNAIKYTEQGTIKVTAQRASANQVEVMIQDTGIGIPADHLPHIFERFYRVESSRTSEGTGLGLAIAREAALSHGGAIEIDSEIDKGTTFTVRLPMM